MGLISKIVKFKIAETIGKKLIKGMRNRNAVKRQNSPTGRKRIKEDKSL